MTVFAHNNGDRGFKRGTFAFELPDKKYLEEIFSLHANCGVIKVGHSRVSKKDNFIKKTGRDIAVGRMSYYKFTVMNVEVNGTKHVYHCEVVLPTNAQDSNEGKDKIWFGMTTIAESDRANLVYAFFS